MSFLQDPDWDDCCEPILLPPTHPNAELIKIPGYTLVYCSGACPKIYRVYKGESMRQELVVNPKGMTGACKKLKLDQTKV